MSRKFACSWKSGTIVSLISVTEGHAMIVTIPRSVVDPRGFNPSPWFPPYELRISCFQEAMQDVYDFFYDVNSMLLQRGLQRLDDMLRPAAMSGIISDMLTARLAAH